jgi:hypothetical protein
LAELQVVNTLQAKRKEIESYIGSLERDLEQARADLSAVLASIRLFSAEGPKATAYMNLARVFPRYELPKLAREALAASPDGISTVEIAKRIMAAKGMDEGDKYLRKSITYKAVQLLRNWEKRGQVERLGRDGVAMKWRKPTFCETVQAPLR